MARTGNNLFLSNRRDETLTHPSVRDRVESAIGSSPTAPIRPSKREMEVLRGISQGLQNKQIADYLNLSVKTVEKHRAALYRRFGIQEQGHGSAVLVVRAAIRKGLIAP
jgi:DNA-binding NarL/FixJ family response regulator